MGIFASLGKLVSPISFVDLEAKFCWIYLCNILQAVAQFSLSQV